MVRIHKPIQHLIENATKGDAQAQYELSKHPVLSEEDRYFWLIKAAQQSHSDAEMELEKLQQEKQLMLLLDEAGNSNIESQYKLGIHPILDATQHYNWLSRAASHGHNEARHALREMDMLLVCEGNKALIITDTGPVEEVLH